MRLTIKDLEARRLAQAISEATGQSLTRVVIDALRESYAKLQRQKRKANVEDLLAIADRAAALVRRPYVDHSALLYDGSGVPN